MHFDILAEVDTARDPNNIANVALGTDPSIGKRGSGGDPTQCPLDDVY